MHSTKTSTKPSPASSDPRLHSWWRVSLWCLQFLTRCGRKRRGKTLQEITEMRNVTLSLASVSLYSSQGCKVDSGRSKMAFTKENQPWAQINPPFINIWFFCFHSDCYDMAVTQHVDWVPQLPLQAILLQNYFPKRAGHYSSLVNLHTCQQHLVEAVQ